MSYLPFKMVNSRIGYWIQLCPFFFLICCDNPGPYPIMVSLPTLEPTLSIMLSLQLLTPPTALAFQTSPSTWLHCCSELQGSHPIGEQTTAGGHSAVRQFFTSSWIVLPIPSSTWSGTFTLSRSSTLQLSSTALRLTRLFISEGRSQSHLTCTPFNSPSTSTHFSKHIRHLPMCQGLGVKIKIWSLPSSTKT